MCLRYEVTSTLNHENTGKHPERISRMGSFIDQCDCKKSKFPFGVKGLEKV